MRFEPVPATRGTVLAAVVLFFLSNPLSLSLALAPQSGAHGAPGIVDATIPRASPTTAPSPSPLGVNVYQFRSSEPAPMGIADYGVNQAGFYQYLTNESLGTATIVSLQTLNSTGDRRMSLQLNVVLAFTNDNALFVYWIQDIAQLNTATNRINFIDNIWNFSAAAANMNAAGISGGGHVASANGIGYYYDFASSSLAGNGVTLTYPATVSFLVSTGINSLRQPVVRFEYEDGFGFKTYDTVTFKVNALNTFSGFVVNGNDYNPRGLYYDSELILGGVGSGWQTSLVQWHQMEHVGQHHRPDRAMGDDATDLRHRLVLPIDPDRLLSSVPRQLRLRDSRRRSRVFGAEHHLRPVRWSWTFTLWLAHLGRRWVDVPVYRAVERIYFD